MGRKINIKYQQKIRTYKFPKKHPTTMRALKPKKSSCCSSCVVAGIPHHSIRIYDKFGTSNFTDFTVGKSAVNSHLVNTN